MTTSSKCWDVTIPYREPEFTQRNPGAPDEFKITYQVVADTADEALANAMDKFDHSARQSSVPWPRKPIFDRIIVKRV